MNDLVVITGQTATGKTKLAIDYAQKLDGEIINADSRQVYKYLDIVTGKDKSDFKKARVKTHLLDIVKPNEPFSSHDFVVAAVPIIEDIWNRKKTPIIVGGTYLYIKHLLYGQNVKIPPNQKLRKELEKKSVLELQKSLLHYYNKMKSTPELNNSDWNNPRRLIRKIEILSSSTSDVNTVSSTSDVNTVSSTSDMGTIDIANLKIIGLRHKNKESLIRAITNRVEKRLEQGAVEEVKKLLEMGYKITDEGLQTIGYKQLIEHVEGNLTLEQAKQEWITKEVQYAKRQLTFMKLDSKIEWKEV